ncbi:MAG: alpha-glucan family phosphorylase, partial [Chloroflexi bacterium]
MELKAAPIWEKVPPRLDRLVELAYNLWWSWHPEARVLFKMLDYPLWKETGHNPVKMLLSISPERLQAVAHDPAFLKQYDAVVMAFDTEMANGHLWFPMRYPGLVHYPIAYFSAEFGIHQSLPIYSGGLGILSGDHSKEASDLGLPFVGVGFMYPQGYFRQRIPPHGWQEAIYEQINPAEVPVRPITGPDGEPLMISVQMDDHPVYVEVWRVQVGRVNLYLMDTDIEQNAPWDRELSARLYGGDQEMRIKQEIILGIGGVRVLRALDIHPAAWHL